MRDNYINVSAKVPYTTVQAIDKLATEYGLSRANMIMKLLEWSAITYGEHIEVSSVTPEGKRNKKNLPQVLHNASRKVL